MVIFFFMLCDFDVCVIDRSDGVWKILWSWRVKEGFMESRLVLEFVILVFFVLMIL